MAGKKKHSVSNEQIEKAEAEILDRSRKIAFYTTEYTVELLANKMKKKEFVIPDYQRAFTWENLRKSKFIESLVMGLPIPFLFFWEMENGRLEVVDGSQRLRTIEEYILGGLKLGKLEELPSLSGTVFNDLSPSRQLKVMNISIRGIVLNEHADDQARFDMFERINTGSLIANKAEVRRGALRGEFQEMVEELAALPILNELAPVSDKSKKERIPEELVARFFAYGDGLEDYKDSPATFVFNYTKQMNEKFAADATLRESYRQRFISVLNFVKRVFPTGFRKAENFKTTPRVRFEALAIGSDLALRDRPDLKDAPVDVSWINSKDFEEITTSDAANVKSKIANRFEFVRSALLEKL